MSNTSKKTFKELSLPHLGEVYQRLDKVCSQFGVEFYLIGAQARDIHLLESGIKPNRGTMDIDFAIMLPEINIYEQIRYELTKNGFEKDKQPYRLIYRKTDTVIDILPFGEIEQEGTVRFTDREVELSVLGFTEVKDSVQEVEIEGIILRVTPLAGIFLLKLVSWDEKPDKRERDRIDVQFILKNYFTIYADIFYEKHLDCIDEIPSDQFELVAGARLIGRDMAPILNRSDKLKSLVLQIIDSRLKGFVGQLSNYSLEYYENLKELDDEIIKQLKKGINDKKSV